MWKSRNLNATETLLQPTENRCFALEIKRTSASGWSYVEILTDSVGKAPSLWDCRQGLDEELERVQKS